MLLLILFVVFLIRAYIILPYQNRAISKQLVAFSPKQINLPENFIPNYIESSPFGDKFVVYAYVKSEGNTWNSYKKALFLINGAGSIISKTLISSSCQHPYTIKDVGLIMDYCEPGSSSLYRIDNEAISFVKLIKDRSEVDLSKRILYKKYTDGRNNMLNEKISYNVTCVDNWGSCRTTKQSLSVNGKTAMINGYSLRNYVPLADGIVAIIFGIGGPAQTADENMLYIFSSK